MEGCLPDADDRDAGPESPRLRLGVTPRRQAHWGPWTRTPSPRGLPGSWDLISAPLEKRRFTRLPLSEGGWGSAEQTGKDDGRGSPHRIDGGVGAGLSICSQRSSFPWVPHTQPCRNL